ncbi:MAG: Flp family type IVb pilin [Firmicutes bacterium]|nr:Flp family type IVb pilin [Bacillota bacterium]MCL5039830.1 Flp family type IVb pilin [Bacillota bacterium]
MMYLLAYLFNLSRGLLRDGRGATTAEYALVLALVVVILISSLTALGNALNQKIKMIIDQITNAK